MNNYNWFESISKYFYKGYPSVINFSEIQGMVQTCAGSTELDLFKRSVEVMDLYSCTDYPEEFELVINSSVDSTAVEICEKLVAKSKSILIEILRSQGIILMPEQLHSDVIDLTKATLEFPYYENVDELTDILSYDETDIEIYAQLCNKVSSLSIEKILTMVEVIEIPDFSDRVMEALQNLAVESEHSSDINPKVIKAWKAFKTTYPQANANIADGFAQYSEVIGLDFEFYFNQLLEFVKGIDLDFTDTEADLKQEQLTMLSENLVGIACLSSDGCEMPVQVIRGYLSRLSNDLKIVSKLDSMVSKLVLGIHP